VKGYETWNFKNRAFILAVLISVLWHCFWFFSIVITVGPSQKLMRPRTTMVSLGPVVDDTIFKALIESRPQLSQTFYRRASDFEFPEDALTQTLERVEPGDVISVPRKKFYQSLKSALSGPKPQPEDGPGRGASLESAFERQMAPESDLSGDLAVRALIKRPPAPAYPLWAESGFRGSETEVELSVSSAGLVEDAVILSGSGNPGIDAFWLDHVRRWRFAPTEAHSGIQKGRVRLRFAENEG